MMSVIQSFACKETAKVFHGKPTRAFPHTILRPARRKLKMLDAATSLEDLQVPPANRLEKLKGDRAGQYSIRINDQWRVCFSWAAGHGLDVEIVDYH